MMLNLYKVTVVQVNGPVISTYRLASSFTQGLKLALTTVEPDGIDLRNLDESLVSEIKTEMRVQRVGNKN